jgi:hypothetical protein
MSRNLRALTSWNSVGLFRPVMGQPVDVWHMYMFYGVLYFMGGFCSCFYQFSEDDSIMVNLECRKNGIW